MEPIDICYTPLDVPARPNIDIQKFIEWGKSVYPQIAKYNSKNSESFIGKQYPWDLVFGCYDGKWLDDFENKFPELAEYSYKTFLIKREELNSIIFLPTRPHVKGISFWHSDVDLTGFRFYVECEHFEKNPLVIRKTVLPNNTLNGIYLQINSDDDRLQKEIYNCNMISPHQAYYINNCRAVHAPSMEVSGVRIAGFVTVKEQYSTIVRQRVRDLIVNSAEKFKDHAILW